VLAVLVPFVALGAYQMWSRENIDKAEGLWRDLDREEQTTSPDGGGSSIER
jgi:hypothetical protein